MRSKRWITTLLSAGALVAALGGVGSPLAASSEDEDTAQALERAEQAADQLAARLMGALGRQLAEGGPPQAVRACSELAYEIGAELSGGGLEVSRTSRRYRNPGNRPDDWERAWLESFETQLRETGQLPAAIHERVGNELRYLRPLGVAEKCLACHGSQEQLDPEVSRLLEERYPEDRATGFEAGDLRGAISVRVALPGEG